MPYAFPFFGFPNYKKPYYKGTNSYLHNFYDSKKNTSSDSFNFKEPEEVKHYSNPENNNFNFLGLNLQSDDLLLLGILFFLYKEGSNDIYLYIILFLLLLS